MAKCAVHVKVLPQEDAKVTVHEQQAVKVNVGGTVIVQHGIPVYDGTYTVVPLADAQTVLETAEKFLKDNIVVKKIPYYETSNDKGGNTVYIGSEVMINGEQ